MRFKKLSLGFGYELNAPFLATLYETQDSYYIDRRLQHLVLAPIEIAFIYWVLADSRVDNKEDIWILFTYLFFGIFAIYIVIIRVFFQTGRIEMIKKSCLSVESKRGNQELTLIGTIPANSQLRLSTDKSVNTGSLNIPFAKTFHLA